MTETDRQIDRQIDVSVKETIDRMTDKTKIKHIGHRDRLTDKWM